MLTLYHIDLLKQTLCVYSQGGRGTNVHVYLPYRGAILCCVYIVRLSLINIFLHVERDKISCVLQPTRFPLNFLEKYITVKEGKISDLFLGKIIMLSKDKNVIKNYIYHTSTEEVGTILADFIIRVTVKMSYMLFFISFLIIQVIFQMK